MKTPLIAGFMLGASLLAAIGPQNAFVLRQGILKRHVLLTVLTCILCDTLLIFLGVAGISRLLQEFNSFDSTLRAGATLFLVIYGASALIRALKPRKFEVDANSAFNSRRNVLLSGFGFSLLNPHVYLDTVLLVGSTAQQFPFAERFFFGCGAALASTGWFLALAYAARSMSRTLATPRSWQAIDVLTGTCMLFTAFQLVSAQ